MFVRRTWPPLLLVTAQTPPRPGTNRVIRQRDHYTACVMVLGDLPSASPSSHSLGLRCFSQPRERRGGLGCPMDNPSPS